MPLNQFFILNNGVKIPSLGFGVFQIDDPLECEQSVLDALQVGYRLIDTASGYLNEEAVGRAIKKSGIPRKEIFVVTKLWIQDASEEKAGPAIDRALKRLQLDYINLYLIHQPMGDYYGACRALEKAYEERKALAIGVSNFSNGRVQNLILHNKIIPAVNQIQMNPFHPAKDQVEWLSKKGIHTMAWGPFAEAKYGIFQHPTLVEIAERYNKNCVSNNPSLGSEKQSNSHFKNCAQSSYYGKYGLF